MRNPLEPRLAKWPFFIGDVLLLGAGVFVVYEGRLPMVAWQVVLVVFCVVAGACLAIMPFLLEYKVFAKLAENQQAENIAAQMQDLRALTTQLAATTQSWQSIEDQNKKTGSAAREISDRMSSEIKTFTNFLQKSNDAERQHLRLEVEKLRRAEADWLQVLVRILDHVHALHQGAVRSGQANVISQLTLFQNACRDAIRRVGLTPFAAEPGEPFNPSRHQLMEGDAAAVPPHARIKETIASGYNWQGSMVRAALVSLQNSAPEINSPAESQDDPSKHDRSQRELSLGTRS